VEAGDKEIPLLVGMGFLVGINGLKFHLKLESDIARLWCCGCEDGGTLDREP
jgi:hypothetical protein